MAFVILKAIGPVLRLSADETVPPFLGKTPPGTIIPRSLSLIRHPFGAALRAFKMIFHFTFARSTKIILSNGLTITSDVRTIQVLKAIFNSLFSD